MAFNYSQKLRTTETVTPTPQTDAGSTSVKTTGQNKPIDFTNPELTSEQNDILNFINSDEYNSLSKDEQIEQLKAKFPFLKELSNAEITTYISAINKNQEIQPTTEKTETTETEKTAETTDTKEETAQKAKGSSEPLITVEKFLSPEFQKLEPEERLKNITQLYLEKNDENFQSLSDEEKEKLISEKMDDIANLVVDEDEHSEKKASIKAIALLQAANEKGVSIDDLKTVSEEERKTMINGVANNVIKQIVNLVDKEKLGSGTLEEKMNAYAETILNLMDSNYAEIKGTKARLQYRTKMLDEFIANNSDIDPEILKNIPAKEKQRLVEKAMITFSRIIEESDENDNIIDKLKNIKNLSPLEKNTYDLKYLMTLPPSDKTNKLIEKINAENEVLERLDSKGIDNPTPKEFLNEILAMEKEKPLSKALKKRKTELQRALQIKAKMDIRDRNLKEKAILNGEKIEDAVKFVKSIVKERLKNHHHKNIEECKKELAEIIEATNGDVEEMKLIKECLINEYHYSEVEANYILDNPDSLAKVFCKADSPEDYNMGIGIAAQGDAESIEYAQRANSHVSEWFQDKNDMANIVACNANLFSTAGKNVARALNTSLTQGMHDNLSRQDNTDIFKIASSSGQISDAGLASFTETFIQTAHNDNDRVFYSKNFTSINNAAVTEGLAAASKYVSDPTAKQQYTHYVEVAAKNYPPETQEVIKTALKTGEISQETLSKTTPAASGDSSKAEQKSSSAESTTTNKNTPAQQQTKATGSQQPTEAQTQTPVSGQNATKTNQFEQKTYPSSGTSTINTTQPEGYRSSSVTTSQTTSYQTSQNNNTTSNQTYNTVNNSPQTSYDATTQALEEKRDAVAEKIKNFQENVVKSTIEHEIGKELTAEESKIIEDYIDVELNKPSQEAINANVQKKIKEIFAKNSITNIYNIIITKFGLKAQDKFIETLTSVGSSDAIRSFAINMKSDTSIIKKLYLKCSNQKLKSELLNYLPTDEIYSMISDGQIANLNDINHKILYDFLSKNSYSMSNSAFASYLQYLSLDEREQLVEMRNKSRGITKPQAPEIQPKATPNTRAENTPATTAQNMTFSNTPNFAAQDKNTPFASAHDINTQPQPETTTDKKQEKDNKKTESKPLFAKNETIKTLDNGNVITNQGTTFAGISNNSYDEEYKEVKQDPIGMKDEILTPGSPEWLRKYNKQQEPPKTAFTMASMNDDEEDFGMPFGSTKVGMGQKINKKIPKQGFRFNA